MQLGVDRAEFLVDRLQLLLGCLQFLVGRLQLLVDRLHFLVRRLKFLCRALQLLVRAAQIFVLGPQFVLQLRHDLGALTLRVGAAVRCFRVRRFARFGKDDEEKRCIGSLAALEGAHSQVEGHGITIGFDPHDRCPHDFRGRCRLAERGGEGNAQSFAGHGEDVAHAGLP